MNPCRMAGAACPNEGTVLVRIVGVGDRRVCPSCLGGMERLGMEVRRLDESAPQPLWRQRNLARDFTGRVLA